MPTPANAQATVVATRFWGAAGAMFLITTVALKLEGRIWYCACNSPAPWIGDVWTSHCSQHPFDPYSFSHFSHGLIFATLFTLIRLKWPMRWQFFIAISLAAAWEVLENSAFVINRYRDATMSLDYLGDSITNSLFDILCCAAGFFVARWLGVWRTIALYAAIEIVMLLLIRDNLTLNVVMLIYPIEAIKTWQTTGH